MIFVSSACSVGSLETTRRIVHILQDPAYTLDYGLHSLETTRFQIVSLSGLAFALLTIAWLCIYVRDICFERLALAAVCDCRTQLFAHVIRLPYDNVINIPAGVIAKRLVDDTGQLRALVVDVLLRRSADLLQIIFLFTYLSTLSLLFSTIVIGVLVLYLVTGFLSAGRLKKFFLLREESRERLAAHVVETTLRILNVRSFSTEFLEESRFSELTWANAEATERCTRQLALDFSTMGYLKACGPVCVLTAGAIFTLSGAIALDVLVTSLAAVSLLYVPVDSLSTVGLTLRQLEVSAKLLDELHSLEDETVSWPGNVDIKVDQDSHWALETVAVRYSYPGSARVLDIPDLKIASGLAVAIVGRSGAGKTSLFKLLYGMLADYSGQISLMGYDIRQLRLSSIRKAMLYVPQEEGLFSGTIADNVAYGSLDPTNVTPADIQEAISWAGLKNDISQMVLGIDTIIENGGLNLSAGQRRRIALARGLIRKPRIMLLDEPLAGVSPIEKENILDTILRLRQRTTVIFSTHDYAGLEKADAVVEILSDWNMNT
ncbi:ABC transporter ATP-binding protein [Microvirga sp. 0TCS3.31]